MTRHEELAEKRQRVRAFLDQEGLDAVLLTTQANFAWYTAGGDNHIAIASTEGGGWLLITRTDDYLITDTIEAPRMLAEDMIGMPFILVEHPWHDLAARDADLARLTGDMRVGADVSMSGVQFIGHEFMRLRYALLPSEIDRYRWLGARCARAMEDVCHEVRLGDSEFRIAGSVAEKFFNDGITPIVLLVAVDERVERFRHPLPTDAPLRRYAMVVACGRKWGLIISLTRFVHVGRIPDDLRRKHEAVARIDAAFIAKTRPGAKVADIFQAAVDAYRAQGYDGEWTLHHQGGATGYSGRDYKGIPGSPEIVQPNQAFAWNPSIIGTKSEDTIIALTDRTEVISAAQDWPMIDVEIDGQRLSRPDMLVR